MTNSQPVILVTGGWGFLGQHIVNLLQIYRGHLYRIRVLDLRSRAIGVPLLEEACSSSSAGSCERFPGVERLKGDMSDFETVTQALKDVVVVIHAAARIDFWQRSRKEMLRINFEATKTIAEACIACNVPHIVYTSTLSVVIPGHGLKAGNEDSPYPSDQGYPYLYGIYAESKALAERHILHVNGTPLKDPSKQLTTCAVRALCMFGENDPWQIPSLAGSATLGWIFRFGRRTAMSQTAYVRNVAWAHILAMDKLLSKDPKVAGRVYLPIDGSPVMNYFQYMEPFMNCLGFRVTSWNLHYYPGYVFAAITESLLYFLRFILDIHSPFNRIACYIVSYDFWFKTDRARKELGYIPLYTHKEAMQRTLAHVSANRKSYIGGLPIIWGVKKEE